MFVYRVFSTVIVQHVHPCADQRYMRSGQGTQRWPDGKTYQGAWPSWPTYWWWLGDGLWRCITRNGFANWVHWVQLKTMFYHFKLPLGFINSFLGRFFLNHFHFGQYFGLLIFSSWNRCEWMIRSHWMRSDDVGLDEIGLNWIRLDWSIYVFHLKKYTFL